MPTAETEPQVREATVPVLSHRFLAAEKARIRETETASSLASGTISPKVCDVIRRAEGQQASWQNTAGP